MFSFGWFIDQRNHGRPWIGVSLVQLALNSDICASNCKRVPYKITVSEAYVSSLESNEWISERAKLCCLKSGIC